MGYTAEYQPDKDLIFVQHEGELNTAVVLDIFCNILKLSCQHNCHRCLADLTQSVVTERTFGIYKAAQELQAYVITAADKMAVVIARDIDDHYFFQTAIQNRGWDKISYFFDFK